MAVFHLSISQEFFEKNAKMIHEHLEIQSSLRECSSSPIQIERFVRNIATCEYSKVMSPRREGMEMRLMVEKPQGNDAKHYKKLQADLVRVCVGRHLHKTQQCHASLRVVSY